MGIWTFTWAAGLSAEAHKQLQQKQQLIRACCLSDFPFHSSRDRSCVKWIPDGWKGGLKAPVQLQIGGLDARVEEVIARISKATFTGSGDQNKVPKRSKTLCLTPESPSVRNTTQTLTNKKNESDL